MINFNDKDFLVDPYPHLAKLRNFTYRDWETDRKSTRLNSSHRL